MRSSSSTLTFYASMKQKLAFTALSSFQSHTVACLIHLQAELLCGLPVTDMPTASKAVEALAAKGVGSVVLTMCEQGALFTEPGVTPTSIQHVATDTVSVVDTTVRKALIVSASRGE